MSDRIAVMSGGRVEQVDSPRVLYERPATPFVADFIGVSNSIAMRVDRRDAGRVAMDLGDGMCLQAPDPGAAVGAELALVVRPEKVKLEPRAAPDGCRLRGRLVEQVYLGSDDPAERRAPDRRLAGGPRR